MSSSNRLPYHHDNQLQQSDSNKANEFSLWLSSLREAFPFVYRASVSKMKSLMSNPNINNAPGIEDVYHGNCSLSGDTDTETYEDNAENTLISEAFQDMIELCLTSFLAVYSPPSPSAVINLFQNCTTTNSTLPKDRIETGENSSVISEVRDEATPNLSHTIASIRHDNQSHDTDTPNPNHVQETLISEQEQGPPDATTPQPQPPIPTSILEPFWCQALYDHFLSSQTHHPLHSTLLQIVSPPTIEVLSSATAAVQGKYKHLWNNKMTYAAEDEKLKKSLLPLIHIMKEALIHCQILMEEDGQEELCNHQVDEGERIASDKSSNNHPDSSSKSLNKSIKIHPNASEWVNSLSQCYLLRQTRLDAKSERDDRGSKLQSTLGILNLLKWNDLFLSINDSIISSLATSSESKYDADTTMLPSLALDMLTSTKMKGEAPLLMEEKYVAEYMSSHYFRFFSIFLVIPSQVKISFDEFGYGASESFHRNKCRLIHWMTDPNFVHNRLWLHIPRSVTSMDDNTGLRIERQLLENGLLFLDACYKLLVLMLQDKNIPQDDENPYMIFLKIHSIVESYLTTACNIAQSYLEKRAVNMEEKQLDLRDDVSVVKGTRSLQKQRFEKIIKEYRERKKERDSALYDGVELTKQRTVVDTAQSTTPHVRISVPLDEMRSAAERKDSNNMISFSEGGQTETEIDLSNTQFKVNQGWMALKIAIGLGRILHSVAVSLGRSTIDIPASSSNESYKFLATQLEMDLYKKSLSLFESIARFLENHTQLLSSSTAHDEYSDWTTVVSDAKPDGLSNDLKSSDVYIQNQLDIADTLSCMGFAQDTKLQLYEDALLSYKRALDIYSFYMGNKSEAVGKSLHNIAILHVAIAGSINDSLSKKDGYEKADQHREDVRNHYEKSLDAWQSVLQCLESNEQSHQDQPHTVNAQRLEIAGVLHYIAKVYVLLNDEENRIYSLEAGLARIQQSFSGINDDGLELKCNIIADLTDAYFTREDYGKITQLLSNDTLQELSNFFPDRDSREGSWYYYVLGESHFKLCNNELAFRYYFWTLCSIQVLPYVEAFKECGTEDIVNHMLSNSASRSAQIVNFNSPFFDVLEKYELLCATFHFAVLLKNFSKQTLLSEAASPRRLNDLICMFEEIRIKAESYREDCVSNGEEFKSKDLHILIADSFFFTGELCFMSETTISEAADMFTEALEYYQSFQEKFPDPNVSHLSLNNEIIQSENSIVNDHLFVFKQLKTLTYMGHCFRKLYLFDDSMQCYKTALQIQKALCANSNVDVVKKDLEVPEKKLDSSLPSDDLELNLAIADTLSGIGFLYADNSHNHASPHLALRYLEDAAALKQELIPSSSSDVRQTMLLELVKIYELSLSIIEVDVNAYEQSSRDIVSDSTSTSFKDKLCQIYFCLGNVFGLLQRYGDSSESYRRCLAILKASNQGEDLMYGSIMYNYGLVLEKLGGTDNLYYAQNSYEISLAVTEKLLGKSHPVLGDTLHSLGSTILERCLIDQYDTAFQFLSRSLSIRISTLGNEHLKVSQTMFMLARIHFIRGRSERVITLLEKVLQIQRKAHGLDHSSLVDSLELLAEAHVNRRHSKDVKIAISCFREAARIRELISGIQNTSTLSTLTRIAFLHTLNGENTEALNFYEKVLPYYRLAVSENGQSLGHDEIEIDYVHSVVRVLNAMGIIHINLRHNKEAKKFFVEALEVLQKYKLVADISVSEPSATSDESILTLHCLAVILDKIGESNDALQFYRRVIVAYRNYLRSDYLLLAHIASRIGGILIDRYQAGVDTVDKLREAEVYFNEALVTFSSEGESNDQLTGNIHFYLAFVGVRIKCETLVGKKETVEHFYHALNILENPAAEQDFLIVSKSIDKRWENQHKIQCEWSFEVMKNVNRVERIKQCLQEILSLKDVLEESVVSNQEAAAMHFRLGNILAGEGMYDEAILHYETTLEVQRSLGSESVLDLSNTLHNYGNVLYKNKQHEFALAAYQESLRLAQSKLGSDQDEIAETMSCIGNVYHKLKVIDDAKQYYTESIRIRRNLFGKDDPSILGPLLNLATIQIKCGEDEAAMKSFKQILQISKAASRGESFEVATALQGIAKIHAKNAVDYNKAISCLQAALHIWNAIYGASHVKVADTTLELGVVYDRLGDFYQARELYDEALAQYILLKGEESLQVAKVLFSIGLVLDETNQQEAAVENLQKALRIYTVQSLGCCEGAGDCLHNLGVAYYKMGFLDKALTSYDSALSAYAQSLAQNDLKTARSLHAKGVVLTQMACTEEALTCFRHSHDIFLEKGSGTENVEGEIGESKYCIGKLLLQRGSFDDALNMLEDALLLKERVEQQSVNNSNDRLSVANILHSQGLIYASRGAHVEAINRFQRSLKVLAEISGAINGRSTISKTNYQLGCSLQELGECQEAMECFEESLRNLESHQEAAGDERVEQQQTSRASDESNILLHKGQVHLQFNDHIEQAWECFQKSLELRQSSIEANDDVFMAHNLIGFGRCLHQQGKYADALDYYNRAISLYSSSSPSLQQFEGAPHNIHLEIARLHHLIGTAKYHLGQQDEAILNLTEALQLFNTLFRHSKDNTEVSMTLHAIGLVFFQQHKTDDAVQSLEKAFDIQVRLGSYNQHFMLITQDLAKLYALQGQSDKALPLLKNLTETYESLSPDKQSSLVKHVISCYEVFLDILMKYSGCSLEVAHLYIRLGSALGSNSNYRQSIHCFHKALKIQTDVFGQDDLTLAPTLHNLGVAEAKAGELLEAEHHLRRSMDNMRATLKRDNYEVAETLSCLADVLYQQSRYEDAIRFYRESASIQRSLVPAAAPNGQSLKLAQTLFKLGLVVESLKNYKAATACYQECFDIQSSVLGPHHPQIDTVLLHMGNISRAQNDFRKAIEHYQSSLEIKQRSPSKKENFSIANILYNMGSAHALLGENESANALFQRALAIYHKVLGSKIIANRSTMTDPTDVPEHEESVDEETETYIMKAVETHRREFDDRLDNADILFNIAALCEQLSDLCTARKFYLLSAKRYRLQQQIQDKFKLSNALYRVGVIYNVSLKLYEPALRYFEECLQIQKNLLGDTHEDVEALLHVIGIVYHKLGVYDLSVRCMEEALAAKNAREGTTPTTDQNSAIFSLATSPHKNSDLPRALALYRDALDKQKSELGENHVYVGRTLHMIGSILKDMGDYMSALDFFTDAMNIFRHQSGSGSLDLANTAFAMGILYFDLKRLDDSMSMYSTSLEERKIRLGDKNVKVGATLNNMGAVHYEMGNYEKAVIFFSNALEIFGPDHEGSGHIYSGLAYAYRELGKKKEASDFFERAIRKESESLGPDHIDIGDLLHNYGTFLADDCNKFIESARYLEESLRIKVLNIGYESLEVSESLFQLSKVYDKTGRLGGAVEALTKSIAIRESYLLEGDPNKKDILCVLLHHVDFLLQLMDSNDSPKTAEHDLKKADVFCKKGNFQMIMKNYLEAIECYESSLIIQERILGLASFTVSNTLHNLGSAELKNKDFERAGYHLEQSITIRKKVIDEDDVEVADSLHNLAIAYRHLNDFNKAIQFFEDSSQIKRVRLGNNALSLAETLYEMGSALLEIENYEKSMRCFLDCLRIRRLKLGVEHLSVSNALFCIGHIHKRRLENSRALQVYRETLKIRRKILGYDSPEIASVLFNMASVLDSLKDYEDALKCYEECQNILERITGQEDLKVATVLLNLGRILAEVEGYVEALECYQQCLQIRQSKLGKEALEVAEVLLYIGMTEEKLSFDDIAMGRYVSALKILENFSGVESSESVARVMYGMALIYAKKSDYDNAFKFANESARIWSTMETSNLLEDVADLYFLLGSLHQLRGDVDDALTLFSQSEQLYRRRLGNEHIAVGNSLYSMGLMKEVKGSHSEAITLFQESLKIKQRLLGADDIDVGHLYYKIGVLTKLQCEYDEASKMLEQALRIQSFNLGAVCEEVGHTELMLGNVYESLLRWDNAADSLENALMIFRELNADPLLLANVLSALGRVRDELGNLEKAIQLFEDSIRLYQQELLQERYQLLEINDERGSHDPTDHSDVIEEKLRRLHLDFADTYFNLGSAYDKAQNGNEEKALGLYRASLEMYVKLIGKDCVDVAKVLSCMGILYAKSGNYVLSRRLLTESLRIRELFFGRDSLEAAASLFALGVVHDKVAEYTKALDCYTEVLRIRQSILGENCVEVAETLTNLGVAEGNMGNLERSLQHWKNSVLIYKRCGFNDDDDAVIAIKANMDVAERSIEMISQVNMYL